MTGVSTTPADLLRQMYVNMLRIRIFEERVAELLERKEIRCPTHLYIGQEAVAVGVCAALKKEDYVFGNHRSHGHYLAKGGSINKIMAELQGKASGCAKGRGGSMHLFAPEVGILGTVPLVSATIPIAVGAALTSHIRRDSRVSISFLGDGGIEEGTFHEAMNFSALKKLSVVFICENNFYSSHLHLRDRRAEDNIVDCAKFHGMPGFRIDGNNVVKVYHATRQAVERCRAGEGPSFLECRTYRWRGHVGPGFDLDVGIRDREELDAWMAQCPIRALEKYMKGRKVISDAELSRIHKQVEFDVDESVRFARESPYPERTEVTSYVFKN